MIVEHHLMNPSETDRILGICSNVLRSHSPVYRNWTEGDRITMLRWYADMGLMLVVEDPDRTEDGIQRDLSFCLVRFIPDIQSRLHPSFSDPAGDIVYIDYVYKGSNKGYVAMFLEGCNRWQPKSQVAFHREDRPDGSYSLLPIRFCLRFCKTLC